MSPAPHRGTVDVLMVDASRHTSISLAVAHCLAGVPDVRLHVLSGRRFGGLTFSRLRESFAVADLSTDARWLAATMAAVAEHDIDVILSVTEPGGRFVAAHREQLDRLATVAPVPVADVIDLATNKGRVTAFAADHGVTVPRTLAVTAEAVASGTLAEALEDFTMPVLLKATTMSAGRGIERFESGTELLTHLEALPQITPDALIVQEIVEGTDICCSVLCDTAGSVVAHSTFEGLIAPEGRFSPWTRMRFHEDLDAVAIVEKLTQLLRWQGPANLDFIRTDDGRYVFLEFNGRYDGETMGSMRAGVNFVALHLDLAQGATVSQPPYRESLYLSMRGVIEASVARLRRQPQEPFTYQDTVLPLVLKHPVSEAMRIVADRVRAGA